MAGAAKTLIGLIVVIILSFGVWAYLTEIDEVARGEGRVIPAGKTQIVQATEPGVVAEIAARVGQSVKQGDLIIRLDDSTSTAGLGEVEARARSLTAKAARLYLEEIGDFETDYACPKSVETVASGICESERELLAVRRQAQRNTRSVLEQRVIQKERELDEARANLARLEGSLAINQRELDLIGPLARRKLVAETELIRVQRAVNNDRGEISVLKETIPRIEGAVREAHFQLQDLDLQFRQEALKQKTEVLAELSVLEESARGESTRVERTEIRAPVDGVINTMEINTLGSFVQPGTVVAGLVPSTDELLVEARISPRDVAFVVPGQEALVKVTAFDFSIYGGLEGEVVNVGSDSVTDQKTGEAYFEVRVRTASSQLSRDGKAYSITPGMICAVDILTGRKTILSYLLKPINKARLEALTER
ncbi:HlyD family type I secretion periplasmic adaptor subunit [Oricola cellulosilytica]|uniref:Membrane fusion protein (MFP) family protein n=1 Tax=Oricola cellulosilytica TaxID=1429082 RepID=A0A4R0P3A2_9HYPH|nr:HlyD family type I secretion periplasmic adaptor subunit [Oricola cellulosilytica]